MGTNSFVPELIEEYEDWDIRIIIDAFLRYCQEQSIQSHTVVRVKQTLYRESRDSWHVSSSGYCPRRRYLDRAGVAVINPMADHVLRKLAVGSLMHLWFEGVLAAIGVPFRGETAYLLSEHQLSGHSDIMLGGKVNYRKGHRVLRPVLDELVTLWGDTAPERIYDIKSASSRSFSYMTKQGPSVHYQAQLATYEFCEHELGLSQVKDGRLTIVSKDDMRQFVYQVDWSDSWEEKVRAELDLLNGHWQAGTLPPCSCASQHPVWGASTSADFWRTSCPFYEAEKDTCCSPSLLGTQVEDKWEDFELDEEWEEVEEVAA